MIDLWEDNQEIPESLWEEVRYWTVNWRMNSSAQTRQPERDAQWLRGYSALLDAVELPKSTDNHPNFEKTTFGSWWNCQKRSMRDKSVGRKIVNTTMTDYQLDLLAEIPIVMAWMEKAKVAAIYRASKEGKEPTAEQISAVEKAAEKMLKTGAVNDEKWNKKLKDAITTPLTAPEFQAGKRLANARFHMRQDFKNMVLKCALLNPEQQELQLRRGGKLLETWPDNNGQRICTLTSFSRRY